MQTQKCSPGKRSDHFDHNESDKPPVLPLEAFVQLTSGLEMQSGSPRSNNYFDQTRHTTLPPAILDWTRAWEPASQVAAHWQAASVRRPSTSPSPQSYHEVIEQLECGLPVARSTDDNQRSIEVECQSFEPNDRDRHIQLLDVRQRIALPRI